MPIRDKKGDGDMRILCPDCHREMYEKDAGNYKCPKCGIELDEQEIED